MQDASKQACILARAWGPTSTRSRLYFTSLTDLAPSVYTMTYASLDKVRRCVTEDMRAYEISEA